MSNRNPLQENLYKLLTELDEICKKYDITYYLAGGNALGSVRHESFLPWDDDVDLFITRDNWNKLKHVVETEDNVLPEGRSLVYNENTPYYRNPIPRYVDNTTTYIYKSQVLPAKACGQLIEFLVLDPIPNDEDEMREYVDLLQVYTELLSPYFVVCKNLSLNDWQRHYEFYERYYQKVLDEGEEKVLKELEDRLFHFPEDECDRYCLRWGMIINIYDKDDFGVPRLEVFEDGLFPIGHCEEAVFRFIYGDSWMYVPDLANQEAHNAFQNPNVPFYEYTESYLEKINRDEVFEKYKRNKHSNVEVFYNRRKLDMLVAKTKVNVESKNICMDLDKKEDNLREMLKNRNYDSILDEFAQFMQLQLSRDVKKYEVFVPISDRNLATLMFCLIDKGRFYDSEKFLKIRKAQDSPLSDELNRVEAIINVCKEISIARYDHKDSDLVQKIIDDYEGEYPNLIDICRAKLWIDESNAKNVNDFKQIDEYCAEVLESYPFDGETMAFQARAKMECGNEIEARELYVKSLENTRNGLIWKKVKEEIGINRMEKEREIIEALNNEN